VICYIEGTFKAGLTVFGFITYKVKVKCHGLSLPLSPIFHLYFAISYSFECRKLEYLEKTTDLQLYATNQTNFITCVWNKFFTLTVIATDCICRCKSN